MNSPRISILFFWFIFLFISHGHGTGLVYDRHLSDLILPSNDGFSAFPLCVVIRVCNRRCVKACTLGNGKLRIEKGMCIQSNVWSVHYNKDTWGDDADQFHPERFDPSTLKQPRHPMSWQPFGSGPRTCIGMRFALMEAKSTMCHLLKRFRIEPCENTKLDRTGLIILGPKEVIVKLIKR